MRRNRRDAFRVVRTDEAAANANLRGQVARFALLVPLVLIVGTFAVIGALSVSAHLQVPQQVAAVLR